MTNWYWPTWADWLQVYTNQPMINLAFKGYCHSHPYWQLMENRNKITKDDQVHIMWTHPFRQTFWYDQEWVEKYQCHNFFPQTDGKLWFTEDTPFLGMYRVHPDHDISFTHGIISGFETIHNTQLLLDTIGCDYTMAFVQNPWIDARPTYKPSFTTKWDKIDYVSDLEIEKSAQTMSLRPVTQLLKNIKWNKFIDQPNSISNIEQYPGMWEYYVSKKEYILYKHDYDQHPCSLAHHDYAVEKVLGMNPKNGKHRDLAKQISYDAISLPIPEFTQNDYVADTNDSILNSKLKEMLSRTENF